MLLPRAWLLLVAGAPQELDEATPGLSSYNLLVPPDGLKKRGGVLERVLERGPFWRLVVLRSGA